MNDKAEQYAPHRFEVSNMDEAKRLILTNEDAGSESRWRLETPYLVKQYLEWVDIKRGSLVLDFGCGIGRVAKELVHARDCFILGVDISVSMRTLATTYVASNHFSVVSYPVFKAMVLNGLQVDNALSIWVLQHCPNVQEIINYMAHSIKLGGKLFVVNNNKMAIPTEQGWRDTDVDIKQLLAKQFKEDKPFERIPVEVSSEKIHQHTFMGYYTR